MDEKDIMSLMTSMMSSEQDSYENNIKKLGYADFNKPAGINIYPKNFESKEKVIQFLDNYNKKMEKTTQDDKVITYTDFVGTLMSSVTDIVNVISYVLVAFVGISLVVSSIMIGVITYISVLERKKEIGILRAIGASKRNISQVFNAETFSIGLFAGLIGIVITLLALIPANRIIHDIAGMKPGTKTDMADYDYYEGIFGDLEKIEESEHNPEYLVKKLKAEGKEIPPIFMACGTEDFLLKNNRDFRDFLLSEKVDLTYKESAGIHEWKFWNEYLEPAIRWLLDLGEAGNCQ